MHVTTALVLCSTIALGLCNECPDEEWKRLENSCFFFSTEERSWTSARDFCHRISGVDAYLVYILSETENDFVKDRLNTYNYEHFFHIGATDTGHEGVFSWDRTSMSLTYTNWSTDEPNQAGNEDCTEMNPGTGTWNDIPCSESQRFVCRMEL
ncbi:Perlucin-like protein [Mizuhopecten yessoensis]|uniref:Perlucin-like protein n=2 Tax=Mizuhopecten yessoensis TaxID=6573 RepID=A0A210PVZ9_MIZYE|nr:Perlucin-like protein [Mizuhopecten yessoensis]